MATNIDCGAGVGRITKELLTKKFDKVRIKMLNIINIKTKFQLSKNT